MRLEVREGVGRVLQRERHEQPVDAERGMAPALSASRVPGSSCMKVTTERRRVSFGARAYRPGGGAWRRTATAYRRRGGTHL